MRIRYNINAIGFMNIFNKLNRAKLKDCFIDNNSLLVYIVAQGELGKAVGKKAMNIKMLEKALNRKIKILEFNPNVLQFTKNCFYPAKIKEMKLDCDIITITAEDLQNRGLLIGKNASTLRNVENIIKRYFNDVKEIKVT